MAKVLREQKQKRANSKGRIIINFLKREAGWSTVEFQSKLFAAKSKFTDCEIIAAGQVESGRSLDHWQVHSGSHGAPGRGLRHRPRRLEQELKLGIGQQAAEGKVRGIGLGKVHGVVVDIRQAIVREERHGKTELRRRVQGEKRGIDLHRLQEERIGLGRLAAGIILDEREEASGKSRGDRAEHRIGSRVLTGRNVAAAPLIAHGGMPQKSKGQQGSSASGEPSGKTHGSGIARTVPP